MNGLSMHPRGEFSFIDDQEGTGLGVAAQILYPVAGLATLISSILSSIGLRVFKPKTTPRSPKVKISQQLRQLGRSRNTSREKSWKSPPVLDCCSSDRDCTGC